MLTQGSSSWFLFHDRCKWSVPKLFPRCIDCVSKVFPRCFQRHFFQELFFQNIFVVSSSSIVSDCLFLVKSFFLIYFSNFSNKKAQLGEFYTISSTLTSAMSVLYDIFFFSPTRLSIYQHLNWFLAKNTTSIFVSHWFHFRQSTTFISEKSVHWPTWPIICTILYELDYLQHNKIPPTPPPNLGQRFLDWLTSLLPSLWIHFSPLPPAIHFYLLPQRVFSLPRPI